MADLYGTKPKRTVVTIGLETFQLVNWFDYRGWEVREISDRMRDIYEQPITLGWVTQLERADGIDVWQARRPGSRFEGTFPTSERAILSISDLLDPDDEDALPR